jgi:hypothetical protein
MNPIRKPSPRAVAKAAQCPGTGRTKHETRAGKSHNKLTNKHSRWQRTVAYGWDRRGAKGRS